MEKDLIYIVHERGIDYVTRDFGEAMRVAFKHEGNLVVYDLETQTRLLDFYCSDDTICDLEEELVDLDEDGIILDWTTHYYKLVRQIEDENKKLEEVMQKEQEKREYQIYLKVKEKLENNS